MKTTTADNLSAEDAKYLALIKASLKEFKEIQKELRRGRAETARLRASSQRRMNETREILRRVEATL